MGCYFYKYFYFISLHALVTFFVSHFTVLMRKIKKVVAGAPDGGKKETMEIEPI